MAGHRAPLETRFWSKVQKGTGKACWLWTGTKNNAGYGMLWKSGEGRGRNKTLAHRISYEMANGPIPEGHIIMHACDNPACVNPAHLKLGTMQANYRDMLDKGRHPIFGKGSKPRVLKGLARGERSGTAKLTEDDVRELYRLRLTGLDFSALARRFDLDPSTAAEICRGTRWAHMLGSPGCPTLDELLAVPAGRSAKRLTEADVLAIRADAAAGKSDKVIAQERGLSKMTVYEITKRKAWKHLP